MGGVLNGVPYEPTNTWASLLRQGYQEEPFRVVCSVTYIFLQVIVAISFQDVKEGSDCLPLTCCPMFGLPRNYFGDELRGGILTDLDLRNSGHIDFAYNFYTWATDMPMTEADLKKLPGRALMWMSTKHCHPLLTRMIQPEW